MPMMVGIDLHDICNFKCVHCYVKYKFDNGSRGLSLEKLKRLFRDLADYGVMSLNLTGGETLARKDLGELIATAREYGLYCCLRTNALLLDSEQLVELRKLGLDEMVISIYGMNNEEYEAVTGRPNSWTRINQSVERAVATDLNLRLRYVALRQNYRSVGEYCRWAQGLGLDSEHRYVTWDIYPDNKGNMQTAEQSIPDELMGEFLSLLQQDDPELYAQMFPKDHSFSMCSVGRNLVHIDSEGNVHPCPNFPLAVGNINEQSFSQIWEESEQLQRIRAIKKEDLSCSGCGNRNSCYQRCIGAFYTWSAGKTWTESSPQYCSSKHSVAAHVSEGGCGSCGVGMQPHSTQESRAIS
jgi:pyrroloquinoline quinone biosynthesis protein E